MARIALKAGESRTIHFDLSPRDLSSVTMEGDQLVAPGVYRITIGEGQPDTGAATVEGKLTVTGTAALPQ
jgi:beta-glucosidase